MKIFTKSFLSENRKLIIIVLLLTLAMLISVFSAFTIESAKTNARIEDLLNKDMESYLSAINSKMSNYLTLANQSNHFTSIRKLLGEVKSKDEIDEYPYLSDIVDELDSILQTNSELSLIWIASLNGNFYIDNYGNINDDEWDIRQRPYYQKLITHNNAFIAEPWVSASSHAMGYGLINPIRDDRGILIGLVGFDFNFNIIQNLIEEKLITDTHEVSFLSADNTIVYDHNLDIAFESYDKLAYPQEVLDMIKNKETGLIQVNGRDCKVMYLIEDTSIPGWRFILSDTRNVYKQRVIDIYGSDQEVQLTVILSLYVVLIALVFFKLSQKEKLKNLEQFDSLTGLPNTKIFAQTVIKTLWENQSREYVHVCFKVRKISLLNEMLGHQKGDELLKFIAGSLNQFISKHEYCCRTSGTRFAMLLEFSDKASLLARLKDFDTKIVSMRNLANRSFLIQLAYGCYVVPEKADDYSHIASCTDMAVDRLLLQNNYESTFTFYDDKLKELVSFERELESQMEEALGNNDFVIHLQGKYQLSTYKLKSAEALVRWNHSTRGMLAPGSFIPLFEKNGFICKMDIYVLEQVCKVLRKWIDLDYEPIPIAINLSRVNLQNDRLVEQVIGILDRYKIPNELIEIEITESAVTENMENLIEIIKRFNEYGISTAIDDFGTGYSTLGTLKRLNIDSLKFDKDFFVDAHENPKSKAIVKNIIAMAKDLNLVTVSEGIETESQINLLKETGGDLVQGFYFSKPIPVEEFEKFLVKKS